MTAADIKRRLKRYQDVRRETAGLLRTLEDLRRDMYGLHAVKADGMPGQAGPGDPVGSVVAQAADLEAQYTEALGRQLREQEATEALLNLLEDMPTERHMLRRHYIGGLTWEDIADESGYGVRQVHNIHGRALQHLAERTSGEEAGAA